MPPFRIDALKDALARHVHVPYDEVETIASQVFRRYDATGPDGTSWRTRTLHILRSDRPKSYTIYDLCRADRHGGVYLSPSAKIVQSIADALNELEGLPTVPIASWEGVPVK
jgi:hypothetical protein